jgi:AraC-like DNA-binding protein
MIFLYQNFIDFVNRVRIERAEVLLRETDMKVEEVAGAVGLPSKTTFIRLFKKYNSMVPSQYREIYVRKNR